VATGQSLDICTLLEPKGSSYPVPVFNKELTAHMALIGQSGSGKSFALGRILEEILIKTRSKVLILDPNADFARFGEQGNAVDVAFKTLWDQVKLTVVTQHIAAGTNGNTTHVPFAIPWSKSTEEDRLGALGIQVPPDYQAYVVATNVFRLVKDHRDKHPADEDTLELFKRGRSHLEQVWAGQGAPASAVGDFIPLDLDYIPRTYDITNEGLNQVFVAARAVSEIWKREGVRSVSDHVEDLFADGDKRGLILDLPSLPTSAAQQTACIAALETAWNSARGSWKKALAEAEDARVPVFLVIDEAHNLAPAESRADPTLLNLLSKIAAEGRKYGLFLVLVTQRPTKLHSSVLSQCDNLCLLKTNNRFDLEQAQAQFGFVPEGYVQRAQQFEKGQALLAGAFVGAPVFAKFQLRRTAQGGRDLKDNSHWLEDPYQSIPKRVM